MTATAHPRRDAARRAARPAAIAAACLAALAAPSHAAAYGWPVKPFGQAHPVRGSFGDPRIGDGPAHSHSFHFGIDVCAPDGTAVYASVSGTARVDRGHPHVVAVVAPRGAQLSYWHIVPAVADRTWVTAGRTVIGHVARGWGHVHLAERAGDAYVNPLRPGALAPWADDTRPRVERFGFERDGRGVGGRRPVHGRVDLVAQVADTAPGTLPAPWTGRSVMPAVVRWRIARHGRPLGAWHVAVDFRRALPAVAFDRLYAPWTRQNKPWAGGRYRVVLAAALDTRTLRNGLYRLEVETTDTRGNRGRDGTGFAVANASPALAVRL